MTVYTLWNQGITGALQSDASAYTMGVSFFVTQNGGTLTGIWWYSAPGAVSLPSVIALYTQVGTVGTLVQSQSASWSGVAGSGWVRASFTTPSSLSTGINYKACIGDFLNNGNFYSAIAHYWDTGAGSSGISNGPLSAPNNASAPGSIGQDSFHNAGVLAFPDGSFNATNYLIDPEVTVGSLAAPKLLMASLP